MAKIDILEPIMGDSGMFYCAGWVDDIYTHFLADYKPTKRQIKEKLLEKYNKENKMLGLDEYLDQRSK